jgi:hypothetical protein
LVKANWRAVKNYFCTALKYALPVHRNLWTVDEVWLTWCGVVLWCGVAHMVRRGSVGSASACWKAGPSSILGSAPQGGFFPTELKYNEEMERGLGEWRWMNVWYHCMNVIWNACIEKDKINKKCNNRHQTFRNAKASRVSCLELELSIKKKFYFVTLSL